MFGDMMSVFIRSLHGIVCAIISSVDVDVLVHESDRGSMFF